MTNGDRLIEQILLEQGQGKYDTLAHCLDSTGCSNCNFHSDTPLVYKDEFNIPKETNCRRIAFNFQALIDGETCCERGIRDWIKEEEDGAQ